MDGCKLSREYVPGLVSIVIPTHNRADIVGETIDSVFAQTYPMIELIIVDDHSTDDTAEVIRMKQAESRLWGFRYVMSRGKGGQSARNNGLLLSQGEYIQFFDDDDLMLPGHIAVKVTAFGDDSSTDFVTCNFNYFEGAPYHIVDEKVIHNIRHTVEGHLLTSSFPAPVFMCRRSCIREIGFWNEAIKRFQDISYFHRLFLKEKRGVFLPDKLFIVRKHAKSISTNYSEQFFQAMFDALSAVGQEWKEEAEDSFLLRRVLMLLQFSIAMQAYNKGLKKWGIGREWYLITTHPVCALWLIRFIIYKMWNKACGRNVSSYKYVYGENA